MRFSSLLCVLFFPGLFCTNLCAVLDKNEEARWEILAAERESMNTHGDIASLRTSVIDTEALDLDLGNSVKPGLFAINSKRNKQTVILSDGEASRSITYLLNLRSEEKLRSVLHVTNDSTVITSHSKQVRQISGEPAARYNISLEHDFEGSVGVASYILHVTTSYARYVASGSFYVSGIVAMITGNDSSQALVSGIGSQGLSFANPDSVKLQNSSIGQVPLSITYQEPGPDVLETSLSLVSVMNSANFRIQDSGTEMEVPLLSYDPEKCGSLSYVEKDETGYYRFPNPECGIGFHLSTQELIFNLNRERSGTIAITVSIPLLNEGDESFETSINIFIGDPLLKKPVVMLHESLDLAFDYYGGEEFVLKMYNILRPSQPNNATAIYMGLPGARYAIADFTESKIIYPIQLITFRTVAPGEEDDKIQKLLQTATGVSKTPYIDLTQSLSKPKNDSSPTHHETHTNKSQAPKNISLFAEEQENDMSIALRSENEDSYGREILADSMIEENLYDSMELQDMHPQKMSSQVLRKKTEDSSTPDVYVVIPPNKSPVKSVSSSQDKIRVAFASKQLALIDDAESPLPEKVFVTMALEGYSIENFTEHKSSQLKMALLRETLNLQNGTEAEIRLVKLKTEGTKLVVEYEMYVSGKSAEIADGLLEKEVSARIARQAYLEENRVEIISTMASMFKNVPANLAGGDSASTSTSSSGGVLIAAIVILALVVAIPLFALCFGLIVTRRHQQESETGDGRGESTRSEAINRVAADPSANTTEVTSPVARDDFGRGEDVTSESFKMQKELFKEGYFGDNKTSATATRNDE